MANQQDLSVVLYDGVSAPTIQVIEGTATQAYEIGDLVKFENAGRIVIADADNIAGIACMAATGTAGSAGDTQFMELINFNALYLMCAVGATAQTDVGEVANITFTLGAHTVAEGAGGEVFIFGLYPGDAVTTSGGRYIVRFNAAVIEAE